MEITLGFIIIQAIIAIAGYIAHQVYNFPLNRILVGVTTLSIVWPLLTLDPKEMDLELTQTMFKQYVEMSPQQIAGTAVGIVVTSIIHGVRR
jgi:hypothetical protein